MTEPIPLHEVVVPDDLSYRRLLESVERFKERGVHALPAHIQWNASTRSSEIVARVAGPYEALADALVHHEATERLARAWKPTFLDKDPH